MYPYSYAKHPSPRAVSADETKALKLIEGFNRASTATRDIAWELEMAMRSIRLASSPGEREAGQRQLADKVLRYHNSPLLVTARRMLLIAAEVEAAKRVPNAADLEGDLELAVREDIAILRNDVRQTSTPYATIVEDIDRIERDLNRFALPPGIDVANSDHLKAAQADLVALREDVEAADIRDDSTTDIMADIDRLEASLSRMADDGCPHHSPDESDGPSGAALDALQGTSAAQLPDR